MIPSLGAELSGKTKKIFFSSKKIPFGYKRDLAL